MQALAATVARPPSRVLPFTVFSSRWDAASGELRTQLTGQPTLPQVDAWEAGLHAALDEVPPLAPFAFLADLRGYEVADVPWEIHRRQREVIPRFLLRLGHRAGYLTLFPEAPAAAPRDPRLRGVAHIHHDPEKMALFNTTLARADERYFTDLAAARRWLAQGPA